MSNQPKQEKPKPFDSADFRASLFGFLSQKFGTEETPPNTLVGQFIGTYASNEAFKNLIEGFVDGVEYHVHNKGVAPQQKGIFDETST